MFYREIKMLQKFHQKDLTLIFVKIVIENDIQTKMHNQVSRKFSKKYFAMRAKVISTEDERR